MFVMEVLCLGVSLSSSEAEVYAASSSACDGILIGKLVAYCTGRCVVLQMMDSAAARGIRARQGVGRIRHWSCRMLWLQQLVKQRGKVVPTVDGDPKLYHVVSGVSGSNNMSDLDQNV